MSDVGTSKTKVVVITVILVLLAGVAVAVFVGVGRQLLGLPAPKVHRLAEQTNIADFIILCAGDSHTEGTGVLKGFDYPSQLNAILSQKSANVNYRVINIAQGGLNSSQVAAKVLDYFETSGLAPNVVIYNAGKNNGHNFTNASFFPEELRKSDPDPAAWFKYLSGEAKRLAFDPTTIGRLNKLAKNPPRYDQLKWDSVLDVHGDMEREFMEKWIELDVDAVQAACKKNGATLCLLNYWDDASPWVDRTFALIGKKEGIVFIDVRNFGGRVTDYEQAQDLIQKSYVPNDKGYALIAETVYTNLSMRKVLAPKPAAADAKK
jgi:lysophospholipase L1-like esterase